jgi:hypothetical protein
MRPVETIPGIGGWGDKGELMEEWIQVSYIVRMFVNVTVYPQYNSNTLIKNKITSACPGPLYYLR